MVLINKTNIKTEESRGGKDEIIFICVSLSYKRDNPSQKRFHLQPQFNDN